jgi:hypothetical protein
MNGRADIARHMLGAVAVGDVADLEILARQLRSGKRAARRRDWSSRPEGDDDQRRKR